MKSTLIQLEADTREAMDRLWEEKPINSMKILNMRRNLDCLSAYIDMMDHIESLDSITIEDFEMIPEILRDHHVMDYGTDYADLRL